MTAAAAAAIDAPLRRDLPDAFLRMLAECGDADMDGLAEALASGSPVVSARVNLSKGMAVPSGVDRVPWAADRGFYFRERPRFSLDAAWHQGLYYVQDASSMIIGTIIGRLGLTAPVVYLDACAAPGGKTTAAIDALPPSSVVVANEYDGRRAAVLRENLMKWGSPDVVTSVGDTARFRRLTDTFDIIAADVPCSGEGMMRKEPEAIAQWSPGLVGQCAALQSEILDNLWPALKPGGYLIYSTCTFNRRENDDNVDRLVARYGAERVDLGFPPEWGVTAGGRFLPHRLRGEGLFCALLRKSGHHAAGLPEGGRFVQQKTADRIIAVRESRLSLIKHLSRALGRIDYGVEVATVKGRDTIPSHSWAMSTVYPRGQYPEVEVDTAAALAYLRRQTVSLPAGTDRGFVLLTHGGFPLGFVKNIGQRANNLYPRHLMLREGC